MKSVATSNGGRSAWAARSLPIACGLLLLLSCGAPPGQPTRQRDRTDSVHTALRADSMRQAYISDSLRDGYHAYRDVQGRIIMEGNIRDGRRFGVWTSYGANNSVKSRSEYADGAPQGITTVFHDNGVLYYTGSNRHGKPVGEWKFYDDHGALARIVTYDTTGAIINDRQAAPGTR